jgi:hypothetical protein
MQRALYQDDRASLAGFSGWLEKITRLAGNILTSGGGA